MKRNVVVFAAMVVVIAALMLFSWHVKERGGVGPHGSDAVAPGSVAPDFTLTDLQGGTMKLSDLRGKTVVLNFWATWCPPCKAEIPWFIRMQKQYAAQGLQVVGVSMDEGDPRDVAKFASKIGINYPVLIGQDKVANKYGGIDYLPTTFYINRNGVVVDRVFGEPRPDQIEHDIERAIASPAKPLS